MVGWKKLWTYLLLPISKYLQSGNLKYNSNDPYFTGKSIWYAFDFCPFITWRKSVIMVSNSLLYALEWQSFVAWGVEQWNACPRHFLPKCFEDEISMAYPSPIYGQRVLSSTSGIHWQLSASISSLGNHTIHEHRPTIMTANFYLQNLPFLFCFELTFTGANTRRAQGA